MCRYNYPCPRCHCNIEIKLQQSNINNSIVEISSTCPYLSRSITKTLEIDPVLKMISTKQPSALYNALVQSHAIQEGCTIYSSIVDALGQELGRYCEIA
jgi:hypothetical protein